MRRRRRKLTAAQERMQRQADQLSLRSFILKHGIAEALKRGWEIISDVEQCAEILLTEVIPGMKNAEQLQDKAHAADKRKLRKRK